MRPWFASGRGTGFPAWARTLTLLLIGLLAAAQSAIAQTPGRVVAIGDVHGNLDGLVKILQQARLIDASRNWSGGNAILIQTGDSIDRGPEMRGVLDFLMALEKQAPKKGGRVIALLGNHEAMNLYGDLRYVTPVNYASFADGNSEKRREKAWKEYVEWRKQRAAAHKQPVPVIGEDARQQWLTAHPVGFFEQRGSFASNGKYGKWLRERPAILLLGDTLFVHGGIAPNFATWKIDALNERIKNEVLAFDSFRKSFSEQGWILPFFTLDETAAAITTELNIRQQEAEAKRLAAIAEGKTFELSADEKKINEVLETFLGFPGWLSIHPTGPLWYRGYGTWTDEEGPGNLEKLAPLGAARFVVGHTPQLQGQIGVRFDGRVLLIDTGMLASYYTGGVPSALEINGAQVTAIYPDRRAALLAPPPATAPRNGQKDDEQEWLDEGDGADLGGGAQQKQQPAPAGSSAQAPKDATNGESALRPLRTAPMPSRAWFGPDGAPLPFQTDEEAMDFLRTAAVRSMKRVGAGINNPLKILLEKDGVQMNAVFREVDEEKDSARFATGRREAFFRDSYIFEIAAYQLARMLGLDNVPPVVKRKVNGTNGSLQLWIENAMTEGKRQKDKVRPLDVIQWNRQVQTMHAFDSLIYNDDRNMGNALIDKNWKLWMIDHTRAFRRYDELKDAEKIVLINREFRAALQALDPATVKAALKESLRSHEVEAVLRRRVKLLEHFDKVIADRGELKTLYTWEPAKP